MQYISSVQKSKELSKKALDRIVHEGLAPTPESYELWYVYYAQSNPDVVKAIDVLETNKQKITDEQCHTLHKRFISNTKEQEHVRQAGDRVQATIQEVSSVVETTQNIASKYNSTLKSATDKLKQNEDKESLKAVVAQITSETGAMIAHNKKLEEKLNISAYALDNLKAELELARKEALTDSLTNLANRKAFDHELVRVAEEAIEQDAPFSLVMMDIDYFKSFNDNFGHQVGDQVLKLVSKTLTDGVKGRDVAARYGGEEFAIILPETPLDGGLKVADYLRKAVEGKEIINRNTGERLGRITMSGGVAEYVFNEDLDDLIQRSDAALYTAKHNGRNQIAIAPAPGQKKTTA